MSHAPKKTRRVKRNGDAPSNGDDEAQRDPKRKTANRRSKYNAPLTGDECPRPAGICTMMRLPLASSADNLDACFVGIPIDHGTSYMPGARFAPRNIRMESAIIRKYNIHTGADPFSSIQVADVGDLNVNLYDLKACCKMIREQMSRIIKNGCRPLVIGGDHTISYPILQALGEKYGPLAMVHIDAHSDCGDTYNGEKIAHGTPFRRAVEENLLDCKKVFQIGIRSSVNGEKAFEFQTRMGFRIVTAKECWYKSLAPLMHEVREEIGGSTPTYISFDIDGLDPSAAPGTGFREIGGLTTSQAMEIIQGCRGLNLVAADLVEVSPPYDQNGMTAVTAVHLLYEMLCVLPGVKYNDVHL